MPRRRLYPSVGELFDRLSIDQIKQVADPAHSDDYGSEIDKILADLDGLFVARSVKLSARLIRLVIALAQINLHIWQAKEATLSASTRSDAALKLSHQLNGIRNQLKAALEVELKDEVGAGVPTNTSHEDLDGWLFSILGNEATFR